MGIRDARIYQGGGHHPQTLDGSGAVALAFLQALAEPAAARE